jgi:hypothetical protein
VKKNAALRIIRHRKINIKMLSGMVEPNGDPTTLKKVERAMRPTPEVVRKWSSKRNCAKQDNINLRRFQSIRIKSDTGQILANLLYYLALYIAHGHIISKETGVADG